MLPSFIIETSILDDNLLVEIKVNKIDGISEYIFFLLRDGAIIEKIYSKINTHNWKLSTSGIYVVQGYYKVDSVASPYIRSLPLAWFSRQTIADFNLNVVNLPQLGDSPLTNKLEFHPLEGDYFDFLLITPTSDFRDFNVDHIIDKFNNKLFLKTCDLISNRHYIFTSRCDIEVSLPLISGHAYKAPSNPAAVSPQNSIGVFSFVAKNLLGNLIVGADFFGFNRIFYLISEKVTVISNRYHTVLLAASSLGVNLSLDVNKSKAHFWSLSHQIAGQNFSSNMDVAPIFQLHANNYLEFINDGWTIVGNEFNSILNGKSSIDIFGDEFNDYIKNASEELLCIAKEIYQEAAVSNKKVLCDLTGGLDSRTVLAVVSNVNKFSESTQIHARETPNSSDLKIALELNSLYRCGFDDQPSRVEFVSIEDADAYLRSHYLGTFFSHGLLSIRKTHNSIHLNGACGEILARPYIPRNFFYTEFCGSSVDRSENFKYIVSQISSASVIDLDDGFNNFIDLYAQELDKFDCLSLNESIDRNYLQFRHGFHFDSSVTHVFNGDNRMPLQSKILFRLHHLCYDELKGLEIQAALINYLNPILLCIEFDSNKDNFDFSKIRDQLSETNQKFLNLNLSLNGDRLMWDAATKRKINSSVRINAGLKKVEIEKYVYESVLLKLGYIFTHKVLGVDDRIYLSLYHALISSKARFPVVMCLYNKISSLVDQYDLISVKEEN